MTDAQFARAATRAIKQVTARGIIERLFGQPRDERGHTVNVDAIWAEREAIQDAMCWPHSHRNPAA